MVSPKVITLASCFFLAACGTTLPNQQRDDLRSMQPDCTNGSLQIAWLERQIKTQGYNAERSDYERQYVARAKELIWTIRSQCFKSVGN
jgi:hypothetical protein